VARWVVEQFGEAHQSSRNLHYCEADGAVCFLFLCYHECDVLDINLIRENSKEVEAALKKRDPAVDLAGVLELDKRWRGLLQQVEDLRAERNEISAGGEGRQGKEFGSEVSGLSSKNHQSLALEPNSGELPAEKSDKFGRAREIKANLKKLEPELAEIGAELTDVLLALPNVPHESVPVGEKEDREVVKEWGEKPEFDFEFKNHVELGKYLGILDFERAATIAGAQFPLYIGDGALLEWSLINFMLRHQVFENGYTPVIPPHLMSSASALVHTTLPKFADDVYKVEKDDLYLIPTAEAVLVNMHRDETFSESDLPKKYTAYTPCYRREAGSYGAKERGLVRVHQFNKVELVRFVKPEDSWPALEEMRREAEEVVEALGLHYRTTNLVASDVSFAMAKTYDIEVWLPGQGSYYEVSSASNGTDFQARRAGTKYRLQGGGKPEFVHILNASGLATSRLMAAILECGQQADGSVLVPEVLREYVGKDVIERHRT